MKMKEFEPQGGVRPWRPHGHYCTHCNKFVNKLSWRFSNKV